LQRQQRLQREPLQLRRRPHSLRLSLLHPLLPLLLPRPPLRRALLPLRMVAHRSMASPPPWAKLRLQWKDPTRRIRRCK
jgi:hypothetical protein